MCSSSRCSRPGSVQAASSAALASAIARASRRSGSRPARGSASRWCIFLAHRVRRIAKYTMPDILELRYGTTARMLGDDRRRDRVHDHRGVSVSRWRTTAESRGGDRHHAGRAHHDGLLRHLHSGGRHAVGGVPRRRQRRRDALRRRPRRRLHRDAQQGGLGAALAALRPDQVALFGTLDPVARRWRPVSARPCCC